MSTNFGGLDAKIQNFRVPRELLIIIIMQLLLYQLLQYPEFLEPIKHQVALSILCSSYLRI